MEKKSIRMLKDYKDHVSGKSYELDSETAGIWIAAGYAEEVKPEHDVVSAVKSLLDQRDEAFAKQLKELAKVESKAPSIRVIEDEMDKKKSLGHFCQTLAVVYDGKAEHQARTKAVQDLDVVYKSTMQVSNGVTGGYTVPETFLPNLIDLPHNSTVLSERATKLPVSGPGPITLPAFDMSITPDGKGQTAQGGGINVKWESENSAAQETNPAFKPIELNPNRLSAFTPVSNYLLANSANGVESLLRAKYQKEITAKKEYAYIKGNGVGQPLGFLDINSSHVNGVTRTTAADLKYADVCNLWQSLPASSQANAVFVCSQLAIAKLLQMQDGHGNAVFHPVAQNAPNLSLLGRPVLISEYLPAAGTALDLCLIDPSMYYIVESTPVISVSDQVRFLQEETVFKITQWVDGQSGINYKVKLPDGSNTVAVVNYITTNAA